MRYPALLIIHCDPEIRQSGLCRVPKFLESPAARKKLEASSLWAKWPARQQNGVSLLSPSPGPSGLQSQAPSTVSSVVPLLPSTVLAQHLTCEPLSYLRPLGWGHSCFPVAGLKLLPVKLQVNSCLCIVSLWDWSISLFTEKSIP